MKLHTRLVKFGKDLLHIKQLIHQAPRQGIPVLVIESTPICEWVFLNTELPAFFSHNCQGLLSQ